jgi:kynurenine formamidase
MGKRWKNRPEGSTWGEFGEDDQRGRLNLLTEDRVRAALTEAKAGKTFCLSLPLDYPGGNVLNPRRLPPRKFATQRNGRINFNYEFRQDNPDWTDIVSDDVVLMTLQYSTQWDSLAHVGALFDADGDGKPEPVYYNGYRGGEHVVGVPEKKGGEPWAAYEGVNANALGVENMAEACLQGRGVMIDLHAHFGREPKAVGYDDLMRVLDKDKVEIQTGDMVCLHTGFAQMLLEMRKQPDAQLVHNACPTLNGRDDRLLEWISKINLSVLIADNYGVETVPSKPGSGKHATLPLHQHCLFKLGVNLGELWQLTPLATWLRQNQRSRFLLTAPPLRLPGAVGSPATPIATV